MSTQFASISWLLEIVLLQTFRCIYLFKLVFLIVELLDHLAVLFFSFFEESLYYFPQWLYQFTFSPTVQEGYFPSTSSPSLVICRHFDDSHYARCEVVSHCCFDSIYLITGLLRWHQCKESTCQCRRYKTCQFDPWVRKIPWRRKWQPTPVHLPQEFYGKRSLAGYSPWGHRVGDN